MGTNRVLVELLGLCVHKRKHKTSEVVPVLEVVGIGAGTRAAVPLITEYVFSFMGGLCIRSMRDCTQ